jgi:hypothetical protein
MWPSSPRQLGKFFYVLLTSLCRKIAYLRIWGCGPDPDPAADPENGLDTDPACGTELDPV